MLPFAALALVTALWTSKLAWLAVLRHDRYGSFDFDAGIFDQAAWLLAHGRQFDTVRGLPLFGHHATFGFYFFAPFYRLGLEGQTVLNVSQALTLGAVPLVVYWVARRVGLESWVAAVAGFVSLAHFSASWLVQELFHPEVFAIAPLLAAYGFARGDQRWPFRAMLFYAIIWKEDVALAVVGLGLVLALQRHRRHGVEAAAFGAVWFLLATQVMLPQFSPTGEAFYAEGFYGDLGDDFGSVVLSFVQRPSLVVEHLQNANALGHVRDLWAPFGYVNLLAPVTLLMAIPQLLANLLSVNSFTWSLRYHYVALPLAASTLGFVLGLARLRGPWRAFAAGIALAASVATAVSWGVGPGSRHYEAGYWPLREHSQRAELDRAISIVPSGASVSASYHLVPHLSSRELIFSFPNPWRPRNWGIGDRNTRDPADIEWLVVKLGDLGAEDRALVDEIIADDGQMQVVYRSDAVLVARRSSGRG
jgi:uncharacterized membrane protein